MSILKKRLLNKNLDIFVLLGLYEVIHILFHIKKHIPDLLNDSELTFSPLTDISYNQRHTTDPQQAEYTYV